ncbi:hypothetical protein [Microcoleus sp. herbarium14]|uniref:hypothetical protein n=1 Tax=Microcoleus sp. herbarium14 TaxID=3055439 RepID=UPI002FCEA515
MAKIEFFNPAVNYYGGRLFSFAEQEIGQIFAKSYSLQINQAKYLESSLPYFPNTYRLNLTVGRWLRGRKFTLTVWEYT